MPLLNKITTIAAIVFMGTSITLAYVSAHKSSGSVMSDVKVQEQQAPVQQAPIAVPMPAAKSGANEAPKAAPEQPTKK
jgi:preprotein translocase subunit SecG